MRSVLPKGDHRTGWQVVGIPLRYGTRITTLLNQCGHHKITSDHPVPKGTLALGMAHQMPWTKTMVVAGRNHATHGGVEVVACRVDVEIRPCVVFLLKVA